MSLDATRRQETPCMGLLVTADFVYALFYRSYHEVRNVDGCRTALQTDSSTNRHQLPMIRIRLPENSTSASSKMWRIVRNPLKGSAYSRAVSISTHVAHTSAWARLWSSRTGLSMRYFENGYGRERSGLDRQLFPDIPGDQLGTRVTKSVRTRFEYASNVRTKEVHCTPLHGATRAEIVATTPARLVMPNDVFAPFPFIRA